MTVTLHHGDALAVLRGLADNSVDAVVTDPPYGLSDHDAGDVAEALACWLRGEEYVHGRGGFMGRSWDAFVPGPTLWREVYRVLKPGGHLLCFAGTRTQDLMGIAIRLAGFECRDSINYLAWVYGSGFPKSHDVGKAIDRAAGAEREVVGRIPDRWTGKGGTYNYSTSTPKPEAKVTGAPATDAARQWDGWGTALKPAHEPILVFRKPLVGTVAANVQQWGTGALHIEACRVGTAESTQRTVGRTAAEGWGLNKQAGQTRGGSPAGRWPPNVVLSHSEQCKRVGTRRVRGSVTIRHNSGGNTFGGNKPKPPMNDMTYADADGLETVDDWRCVDGCPVKSLAEQSGVVTPRPDKRTAKIRRNHAEYWQQGGGGFKTSGDSPAYGDTGTAARFFPNFEWSPLDALDAPWLYTAKASRREREAGLEGMERKQKVYNGKSDRPAGCADGSVEDKFTTQPARNHHPTVKPLALMRWLVRLVTPPGGVVLDPFTGSGTTGMAAAMEGFNFIGIEQDAEYLEIARRRIAWAEDQQPPLLRATGD